MSKRTCACGKSYWPNQAWMHKECIYAWMQQAIDMKPEYDKLISQVVVDINTGEKLVVDGVNVVVVDTSKNIDDQRKKDRHKKTEQRKEYQRQWVKGKRASV